MIEVSEKYKKAIYKPKRYFKGRVKFKILDYKAYKNSKRVSSNSIISRQSQLTNDMRMPSAKYATFEKDYFKLDGSFAIPPKANEGNFELGWWSESLSNENNIFDTDEFVELTFDTPRSSMGVTIYFDVNNEEYPVDFDLDLYSEDNILISHNEIINNKKFKYEFVGQLNNFKKLVIKFIKWCKPYRRAKVLEIDIGIIKTYEDNSLIKMNILEEMDILSDTLPSNEVKFTIDNSSKDFNILNPKGFAAYLVQEQEIIPELGLELEDGSIEYVSMGKYYLKDWQSDEGALTSTFTGRDIIENLKGEYKKILLKWTNLYDFADNILNYLGIAHDIDYELKNIQTLGYSDSFDVKKIIQYIAITGRCAIYQDRLTDKLVIKQFKSLDQSNNYMFYSGGDMFCGMVTPQVDGDLSFMQIDFDNVFSPPKIELDDLIQKVEVVLNEYYRGEEKDVIDSTIKVKGEEELYLKYNSHIYDNKLKLECTNGSVEIIEVYNEGAYVRVKGNGEVKIKGRGTELLKRKTTFTLRNTEVFKGKTLTIDNPLINKIDVARKVAEWIFNESKNRAKYSIDWRMNPVFTLGEIVVVEDSYGEKKQSRILKQEFSYEGYLKGKTETKGGV
ncbi:MAG: hypothetical protein ACRCVJ_12450 [Clostridium sp.]|uniref:hypothetical protein n=1 Tax=Clostridium sp. TaxID=1506 RepID=UPI003F3E9B2F